MNDPASQLALIESLKDNAGYRDWYVPALNKHLESAKERVLEDGITPEERQNRYFAYTAVNEVVSLVRSQEAALTRILKAQK